MDKLYLLKQNLGGSKGVKKTVLIDNAAW